MQSLLELRDAELLRPEYLWLLAPFVALSLYSIVRGREKLLVTLARTLLVALVLFALAQPVRKQVRTESELPVVFDASASILPEAKQALLGALRPYLASGVPIRLYPFARSVSSESIEIESTADLDEVIDGLEATTRSADSGDTNIALAITTAAYRSPSSPLLLLSDGFETSGDARQAASLASTRGVSVFPVVTAPELFSERGLSISALDAPLTVHAGDLAEVRMSLKNSLSDGPRTGTLELFADDKKLFSQNVSVGPMSEKTFFVKTGALEGGAHRLRAQVTVDGTKGAKREVHRWISAKTRSKILLISGSEGDRRVLRQLLAHKGYSVEDLVADGNAEIPTTFTAYSSVIMNNVSERQLPRAFLPSLREHVRGGGGLLLIGGDRSYGLGGYIDTPLEEISPLKFVPPKTTQRRLNSGVILVIDKSKSMAQEGKIDAAKGAALLSIGSMNKEDYVGVI
ncbi:MAG: hypothetical protein IT290_07030, partial [Deltaproteobacteria bacterium]|nr:hypothetical protein [Deltaproteobacteria bacterium]